jgi:hypothetical protein
LHLVQRIWTVSGIARSIVRMNLERQQDRVYRNAKPEATEAANLVTISTWSPL